MSAIDVKKGHILMGLESQAVSFCPSFFFWSE